MISSFYFLPHGMQIIPGMEDPYNSDFEKLHIEMEKIQQTLGTENPKTVILVTPHGLNLQENFLIYEHNEFNGHYYRIIQDQSVVYGELVESKNWKGDLQLSQALKEMLANEGFDVQGLTQGFADYPLTLAWGETVPLFYLPKENKPRIVIIGIPRSRHEKIHLLQGALAKLGQRLIQFCQNQDETISIIFSGDLSHTHTEDGPYGFDPSSKEFDSLVQEWSKDLNRDTFDKILELQKTALACGMAGMSMIQGIADKHVLSTKSSYYDLPTYFGMIVNQWELKI